MWYECCYLVNNNSIAWINFHRCFLKEIRVGNDTFERNINVIVTNKCLCFSDNNKNCYGKIVFVHTNAHNYNICWKDFTIFQNNFLNLNSCVRYVVYDALTSALLLFSNAVMHCFLPFRFHPGFQPHHYLYRTSRFSLPASLRGD